MSRILAANRLTFFFFMCLVSLLMVVDKSSRKNDKYLVLDREFQARKVRRSLGSYSKESMQLRQKERRDKLERECHLTYDTLYNVGDLKEEIGGLKNIIVDDKHRLLYCYVPKVASTNWKRILLFLSGKFNTSDPLSIPAGYAHQRKSFKLLSDFPANETFYRIQTYKKFMFVRHPFERLVSAYINKFVQNYSDYFHSHYGRIIVRKFRRNASADSLANGRDVTFPEFAQYITDPETREEVVLNEHWRPIGQLCAPCHIRYDVLGKHETLEDDSRFVFEEVELGHSVKFPKRKKRRKVNWKFYFDQLTPEQIQGLVEVYEMDFRLFGYTLDDRTVGL